MPAPGEELLNVIQDQLWGLPDERLLGSWQLHQVRPGDVVGEVPAMGQGHQGRVSSVQDQRWRLDQGSRGRASIAASARCSAAMAPGGAIARWNLANHRRNRSSPERLGTMLAAMGPASSWAMMAACSEPTVSSTTASSPAHDSHGGSSTPGLARRASTTRHRAAGRPRARGGAVRPGRLDRRAPGAAHRRRPPRTGCRAGGHPRGRRPTTVGRPCSWPRWAALTVLGVTQGAAGHVGHAHWAAGARVMGAAAP
jgi:hypothetical protein